MALAVRCSHCGASYSLGEELRGKSVRCKACGGNFPVGASEAAGAEPARVVPSDEPTAPATEGLQAQPSHIPVLRRAVDMPRRYGHDEDRRRPNRGGAPVVWIVVGGAAAVLLLFGAVVAVGVLFLFLQTSPAPSAKPVVATGTPIGQRDEDMAPFDVDRRMKGDHPRRRVPIDIPKPDPVALTPPAFNEAQIVVALPEAAADVTVGGGGRYLILHLPNKKELAVFDVSAAKLVQSIPASAANIKFAAGMDKLIVVRPDDFTIERWSLKTFQRETEVKVEMQVPPVAVALGCASNGPLVISGCDWPRLGETVVFDIIQMKKLDVLDNPHDFFRTSPTVQLRASADGKVVACQNGAEVQMAVIGGDVQRNSFGSSYAVPASPDRTVIYTDAGCYSADLQLLRGQGDRWLPARHGSYCLRFLGQGRPGAPRNGNFGGSVFVYSATDNRFVARLDNVEGVEAGEARQDVLLPFDQRYHFLPDAKVLIVISPEKDKLILYRLDLSGK
jgi:hypothetical protein